MLNWVSSLRTFVWRKASGGMLIGCESDCSEWGEWCGRYVTERGCNAIRMIPAKGELTMVPVYVAYGKSDNEFKKLENFVCED